MRVSWGFDAHRFGGEPPIRLAGVVVGLCEVSDPGVAGGVGGPRGLRGSRARRRDATCCFSGSAASRSPPPFSCFGIP